jgi:hypothetical protein
MNLRDDFGLLIFPLLDAELIVRFKVKTNEN